MSCEAFRSRNLLVSDIPKVYYTWVREENHTLIQSADRECFLGVIQDLFENPGGKLVVTVKPASLSAEILRKLSLRRFVNQPYSFFLENSLSRYLPTYFSFRQLLSLQVSSRISGIQRINPPCCCLLKVN